jgi:hypothetical protein
MSKNFALESAGTVIPFATSSHSDFLPEGMIDNNDKTFWLSTGLFPQEFWISFKQPVTFKKISIVSTGSFIIFFLLIFEFEVKSFYIEKEDEGSKGKIRLHEESLIFF